MEADGSARFRVLGEHIVPARLIPLRAWCVRPRTEGRRIISSTKNGESRPVSYSYLPVTRMDRFKSQRKGMLTYRPVAEMVEPRVLLSHAGVSLKQIEPAALLRLAPAYQAVRPNTPVAPFGAPLASATFLDPSSHILNGNHVIVGQKSLVGPYATLDGRSGFIKLGSGSQVLDNATIVATLNPQRNQPTTNILIGDAVSIGFGATVYGPSTIGAYGTSAKPTGIGPNALIDGATIRPGAVVGALARVGPGVTVPAGMYVLPGKNITTQAEASNPALGKVEPLPASILADLTTSLARGSALASGYTNLYQGNSATGVNTGVDPSVSGVFNGNLAAVRGTSQEPGPTSSTAATGVTFEPSRTGPKFPGPFKPSVESDLPNFPARITGDVRFTSRVRVVAHHVGRSNAFRADQGQPIKFASAPLTGRAVTINSPLGGTVTTGSTTKTVGGITIGNNLIANTGAVLLGGPDTSYTVGDNVTLGRSSVVDRSSIGAGATIGARAYVSQSTVAPGAVIPDGEILINNQVVGTVAW